MKPTKITIGGVNGNGGREYRVYFGQDDWVSFDSMPGDHSLYEHHHRATEPLKTGSYVEQARNIANYYVGRDEVTGVVPEPHQTAIITL